MSALLLNTEWDLGDFDYQDMVIANSSYSEELDAAVEQERHDKSNLHFKQSYTSLNFMATLSFHVHKLKLEPTEVGKKSKSVSRGTTFKSGVLHQSKRVLIGLL